MFSFVLILSTPPSEKKVDQNIKMLYNVKIFGLKLQKKRENIGVRHVCIICYQLAVFVQGVLVFSKGFPLHAGQSYFERHKQQTTFDTKSKLAASAHFVKFSSDPIELGLD